MNKASIFTLLMFLIGFIGGCSDLVDTNGSVTQEFQILNTSGQPTTSFAATDTIVFVYRLHNNTGKDLNIGMAHGGPLVRFFIQLDTLIVKDSFEGFAFTLNAPSYPFPNNETIEQKWIFNIDGLAGGTYTAKADPEMFVENEGVPSEKLLTFVIN